MDGVPYVYDANGNLLNDGVNTYAYDSANRLVSVSSGQSHGDASQSSVTSYQYNGLGDRLSQNGVNYTLDLNTGLTQVLSDGRTSYTYGLGRISQLNTDTLTTDYFLGDALGSVRQLTSVNDFGTIFGSLAGKISGVEIVYDYATMTRARFAYTGEVTGLVTGVSVAIYAGVINGFGYRPFEVQSTQINDDYKGTFVGYYGGVGIRGVGGTIGEGVMAGVGYFQNPEGTLKGEFAYASIGAAILPVEGMKFKTNSMIDRYSLSGDKNGVEFYADESGHVNRGKLISDILTGDHSPSGVAGYIGATRIGQLSFALLAAQKFESYHDFYLNSLMCYPPKDPYKIPEDILRFPTIEDIIKDSVHNE